ncbi:MAG: hypothetical protein SF097_26195, partial [Acidobacteriota bacterium]|nr:hypothetical protein [Acidobacteriota bacterium]
PAYLVEMPNSPTYVIDWEGGWYGFVPAGAKYLKGGVWAGGTGSKETQIGPLAMVMGRYGRLNKSSGGGGSGAGSTVSDFNQGPVAKFDEEKFKKCLMDSYFIDLVSWKFDRNGGQFKGKKGTQTHEVNINTTSRSAKELGEQLKALGVGDGRPNSGAFFKSDQKTGYVASDVVRDNGYKYVGVLGVAIHELGNLLAMQTTVANPYSGYKTKTARGENISDPDAGAAFETCVFGGLVGLQSGRVGNKRELK